MSMSMDNVPTLGSALLRGDEQSRSQVNSLLLRLVAQSSAAASLDETAACSTRRRGGKRRQRKATGDKKDRKRRRKEVEEEKEFEEEEAEVETKKGHNKKRHPAAHHVDRNKSAGTHKKTQEMKMKMKVDEMMHRQITTEPEVVEIRRTASEEVFVPMLPTADVYDYFDYHYYLPQSAYSTPLPSPHTRSTPSSPFASPFLSCETRSSIHVPSASFSYAPSTVVALSLAPSISSFSVPCPTDAIWALPSRPATPTLDYCTQLLLQ